MSHLLQLEDLREGQNITLEDSERFTCSGVVLKIDLGRRLLKLRDCVDLETNKKHPGNIIFPEKEIRCIKSFSNAFYSTLDEEEHRGRTIPTPEQTAEIFGSELFDGKSAPEIPCVRKQCWATRDHPPELTCVPQHVYMCTRLRGGDFDAEDAMDEIANETIVGVSFEGILARSGHLSLICIATKDVVFQFDIVSLGPECLGHGSQLRRVLETDAITKVIHNASSASDLLFHKYKLELCGVYDTLAAHITFMSWAVHNDYRPRYAISYFELVRCYLGIMEKHLPDTDAVDAKLWLKRPLQIHLAECALKNVVYLLDLHVLTSMCREAPLNAWTRTMLSCVRDVSSKHH